MNLDRGMTMSILLNVPWVTQLQAGSEDPTGCWYASTCMIGYFFEVGPRMGAPSLFSRPLSDGRLGHYATGSAGAMAANPTHHEDLAHNEGFKAVANCASEHIYSLQDIEDLLRNHGPVFMYWFKRNGAPIHRSARTNDTYGHASVIIGTDQSGLIFHDPEYRSEIQGARRTLS